MHSIVVENVFFSVVFYGERPCSWRKWRVRMKNDDDDADDDDADADDNDKGGW